MDLTKMFKINNILTMKETVTVEVARTAVYDTNFHHYVN